VRKETPRLSAWTDKTAMKKNVSSKRLQNEASAAPDEALEYQGVCESCVQKDICVFKKNVAQAVLSCDEYEFEPASGSTGLAGAENAAVRRELKVEFKGLCANCDVRNDCNIPKPTEGVWHCVEYR